MTDKAIGKGAGGQRRARPKVSASSAMGAAPDATDVEPVPKRVALAIQRSLKAGICALEGCSSKLRKPDDSEVVDEDGPYLCNKHHKTQTVGYVYMKVKPFATAYNTTAEFQCSVDTCHAHIHDGAERGGKYGHVARDRTDFAEAKRKYGAFPSQDRRQIMEHGGWARGTHPHPRIHSRC